jgi:hypothetical protein
MRNSTRAALAIGLGLVGAVGMVAPSMGQQPQDAGVRQAATTGAAAQQPKGVTPAPAAVLGTIDMEQVPRTTTSSRSAWRRSRPTGSPARTS